MELAQLLNTLKREYTYDFSFRSVKAIADPRRDSLIELKTRKYFGTRALMRFGEYEYDIPSLRKRGVQLIRSRDALFHTSLALILSVPTFDSSDRQYDSRHTLYLIHGWTDISAVYCKEGYEIAELYVLKKLTAVSRELYGFMKEARFPVSFVTPL